MNLESIRGQTLNKNTQQIFLTILNSIQKCINNSKYSEEKKIHEVRKNIKKLRAVLRLVKYSGNIDTNKYWDKQLKEIAQSGSELREKYLMLNTLDDIVESYDLEINIIYFDYLYNRLTQDYNMLKFVLFDEMHLWESINHKVNNLKNKKDDIRLLSKGEKVIEQNLVMEYQKGREQMSTSQKDPTFKNCHQWRKSVKYLWYEIRILKIFSNIKLHGYLKKLHNLSEILGDAHDLSDLKTFLKINFENKQLSELNSICSGIDCLWHDKIDQAFEKGSRIFKENSDQFMKKFKNRLQN